MSEALVKKIAGESVVLALEAGLAAVCAALRTRTGVSRLTGSGAEIVPVLITKAFNNTKSRVVELAQEIVVNLIEVSHFHFV